MKEEKKAKIKAEKENKKNKTEKINKNQKEKKNKKEKKAKAEKTNKFVDRLLNTIKYTWKDFLTACENLLFAIIRLIPTIVILLIIFVIYKIFLSKKIK